MGIIKTEAMERKIDRILTEYNFDRMTFDEAKGELLDLFIVKPPLSVEDFHIGFKYEEYQLDSARYLNKGMIWVNKKYGLSGKDSIFISIDF